MYEKIPLIGAWCLQGADDRAEVNPSGKWIPAQVPGDVHVDLMATGEFDEIYFADTRASTPFLLLSDPLNGAPKLPTPKTNS